MNSRTKRVALAVCALLAVAGGVLWVLFSRDGDQGQRPAQQQRAGANNAPEQTAGGGATATDLPPHDGWVKVGGVWRPPTDVQSALPQEDQPAPSADKRKSLFRDPGRSPRVALDANPQVASVVEALRSREHPERLTSFQRPLPFDLAAFQADPEKYLNTVEPGRVYQAAPAGEGVQRILRLSPRYRRVLQGETVTLQAKADPHVPVTFFSARLGQFSNQLTAITVRADAEGVAETQFTATPGTRGDIDILAASPTNSHQARFVINVRLPEPPPQVDGA